MTPQKEHPGGENAGAFKGCSGATPNTLNIGHNCRYLKVRTANGDELFIYGREAQTLALLIEAGEQGFTAGEASRLGWARRTSSYVHKLRLKGFPITTTRERIGDSRVGRYHFPSRLEILERTFEREAPLWIE